MKSLLNAYLCLPLGENGRGIEFVLSAKTFDKTLDDGEMVDLKMGKASVTLRNTCYSTTPEL